MTAAACQTVQPVLSPPKTADGWCSLALDCLGDAARSTLATITANPDSIQVARLAHQLNMDPLDLSDSLEELIDFGFIQQTPDEASFTISSWALYIPPMP